MGELFGTDGIRGVAGEPPLDPGTIYRIGHCLTNYLKSLHHQPQVLIARDTRMSGPWIESVLARAVSDAGGIPEICGVISTPAVAFLTNRVGAHAGIMISASHNPYQDNGIKIFSSNGTKFGDAIEQELERKMSASILPDCADLRQSPSLEGASLGSIRHYGELYTKRLRDCLPEGFTLSGRRLVVDCAQGALSTIAPEFLASLGADVRAIHCEPDGYNINLNSGALHLSRLREEVCSSEACLGIAFDGDADRAMFIDHNGVTRDGDDVLYILARYSELGDAPRTVVGTVMANLGLEIALKEQDFQLVRTSVGDKYVLEEMLRLGALVGGEQSGHMILMKLARTGDGLLTALKVLEAMNQEDRDIAELCRPVKRFPQILLNVPVREKIPFEEIAGLHEAEAELRRNLGSNCRILLRYSGTEKLARVMVEGDDEVRVKEAARTLAAIFEEHLATRD